MQAGSENRGFVPIPEGCGSLQPDPRRVHLCTPTDACLHARSTLAQTGKEPWAGARTGALFTTAKTSKQLHVLPLTQERPESGENRREVTLGHSKGTHCVCTNSP